MKVSDEEVIDRIREALSSWADEKAVRAALLPILRGHSSQNSSNSFSTSAPLLSTPGNPRGVRLRFRSDSLRSSTSSLLGFH